MAKEFSLQCLTRTVAQVSQTVGFSKIQTDCLNILTHLLNDFLRNFGESLKIQSENCNRTEPNLNDIFFVLRLLDIDEDELIRFMKKQTGNKISLQPVPKFPVHLKDDKITVEDFLNKSNKHVHPIEIDVSFQTSDEFESTTLKNVQNQVLTTEKNVSEIAPISTLDTSFTQPQTAMISQSTQTNLSILENNQNFTLTCIKISMYQVPRKNLVDSPKSKKISTDIQTKTPIEDQSDSNLEMISSAQNTFYCSPEKNFAGCDSGNNLSIFKIPSVNIFKMKRKQLKTKKPSIESERANLRYQIELANRLEKILNEIRCGSNQAKSILYKYAQYQKQRGISEPMQVVQQQFPLLHRKKVQGDSSVLDVSNQTNNNFDDRKHPITETPKRKLEVNRTQRRTNRETCNKSYPISNVHVQNIDVVNPKDISPVEYNQKLNEKRKLLKRKLVESFNSMQNLPDSPIQSSKCRRLSGHSDENKKPTQNCEGIFDKQKIESEYMQTDIIVEKKTGPNNIRKYKIVHSNSRKILLRKTD